MDREPKVQLSSSSVMSRSAWYRLEIVLVILLSFRNSTQYLILLLDVHRNPQTFLNSHSIALVHVCPSPVHILCCLHRLSNIHLTTEWNMVWNVSTSSNKNLKHLLEGIIVGLYAHLKIASIGQASMQATPHRVLLASLHVRLGCRFIITLRHIS